MKINTLAAVLAIGLFVCLSNFVGATSSAPEHYTNPVLSGYFPDPSIVRVKDTYYMVNSSFEWFPGMPIHKSKDLVNWELIGYGLHRPSQLNLQEGLGDYMGIFAVTIRYHEGLFYLITTCVQCEKSGNFFVTAKDPAGPWSDPTYLDAPGIDPSLMWDDNGKAYYVGHGNLSGEQAWPDQQGVWLQEFDHKKGILVGPRKQLTFGHANNAVWTEGPHLYKINGNYLLLVAEGGTGVHHSVTVHHSDNIWGPYIADQINPVLTHRHLGKDYPVHSVGHADIVQTQQGDWWAVMLGKRYVDGFTLLARETFLTPVSFEDKTPIFNPGVGKLLDQQKRPNLPWTPVKPLAARDEFTGEHLNNFWNFLRTPQETWYELNNGRLTLQLRAAALDDLSNPSLIARRLRHHSFTAKTAVEFATSQRNEEAGLVLYRRSTCHYAFSKTAQHLVLTKTEKGEKTELARIPYSKSKVVLAARASGLDLQFSYGSSESSMSDVPGTYSMAVLSDEVAEGFNGPYVGMYASSNGRGSESKAVFRFFEYDKSL